MTKDVVPTKIVQGGLRYASKPTGSPFGAGTSGSRSCIYCGEHRSANQRRTVKLGGRNEVACEPPCAPSPAQRRAPGGAASP
jgi:hypothetical protein